MACLHKMAYIHCMKNWPIFLLLCALLPACAPQHQLAVGTYTNGKASKGGLYLFEFDSRHASSILLDSLNILNPSFVAVAPGGKHLYAVREETGGSNYGGAVAAIAVQREQGRLKAMNEQPSMGNHPCYVALHRGGKWLAVGNYSSGTVAILPVAEDGALAPAVTHIAHQGSSVHRGRQAAPHVHATVFSPDGNFLLVPDLGTDKLMMYRFDQKTGGLKPAANAYAASSPGAGPRHVAFHPSNKFVYLVEELTGTIAAYRYGAAEGSLTLLQNIASTPPAFTGFAGSADVHVAPNGKFLYASNRGDANNIAIFSINKSTGLLTPLGHQPTLGKAPRNFTIHPSGRWLLVGNQDSNEIVVFEINKTTGLLTDSGKRISLHKPVCLQWVR
ncbi:MAG: lactonase family protein [Chitinophagaceae bacterium]|nr:MAG: lactonase family protein [Chitinophagaceae bacterium]